MLGCGSHGGFPELAVDKSHQVFISLSTVAVTAEKTTYFNGLSDVENIVSKHALELTVESSTPLPSLPSNH